MPMLDSDINAVRRMFETNVFAALTVSQAFAPLLIVSKGTIVNIGSVAGEFPLVYSGMYNASKAALRSLSEALRVELMPFDVKVILVITGIVKTRLFKNLLNKEELCLPGNSLYIPIKEQVDVVMKGKVLHEMGQMPEEYARGVVDNALRRWPSMVIWRGGNALLVWVATRLAPVPRAWMDWFLYGEAGLLDLRRVWGGKVKSS